MVGTRFIASESLENPSAKTGVFGAEIGNWFSERLPHMGAKKKYKAHISKYVRPILKYLRHIFCSLKTRPAGAGDQRPFGRISVCLLAPKMRTKRRHGRVARHRTGLCPATTLVEARFIAPHKRRMAGGLTDLPFGGECKLKIPQPFAGLRDSCVICRGCPYLTRTFCLPTMYMPFARPLVAPARATLRRMSTPSML